MLNAIRGGDLITIVYTLFSTCILLLVCTPAHECAHAFAAKLLGDDTAERMGRLTLNPIAHFDPVGTIGIILFGIGWAKPVPVNTARCRKVSQKTAMVLTAAAGPLSNFLMALIFMIIMKIVIVASGMLSGNVSPVMIYVCCALEYIIEINLMLGVFNLVPLPPLDGSRVLLAFLPNKIYFGLMKYERFIMIAVMVLVFSGILSLPLSILSDYIYSGLNFITSFIC